MTEENLAFASLESSMRDYLSIYKGVDRKRLAVSLVPEAREGKPSIKIDVLLDGILDLEGEALVCELFRIASPAAELITRSAVS